MRLAITLCLCLTACELAAPPEAPSSVEAKSQAMWSTTPVLLPLDAGWGASLAACPDESFAVGGPLANAASLLSGPVRAGGAAGLGGSVACVAGSVMAPKVLAGSPQGLFSVAADGGWTLMLSTQVLSLSVERPGARLLVGEGHGAARVLLLPAGTPGPLKNDGGPSDFGAASAWFPANGLSRVAIGSPSAQRVDVYRFNGALMELDFSLSSMDADFGRALAVGNVASTPGVELLVGAKGSVTVYDDEGSLIWRFPRGDLSFGTSIAVERVPTGTARGDAGLDPIFAFWVGAPQSDAVYRYVGDAGVLDSPVGVPNKSLVGTSLAVDPLNRVATGAPEYVFNVSSGAGFGAVFVNEGRNPTTGSAARCDVTQTCSVLSSCEVGVCVGGVVCEQLVSACAAGQTCDGRGGCSTNMGIDAGVDGGRNDEADGGRDAGAGVDGGSGMDGGSGTDGGSSTDGGSAPDGGAPRDGGSDGGQVQIDDGGVVVDAGLADAGSADAGGVDAGSRDGGELDGGESDAGTTDGGAGPSQFLFTPHGCSATGESAVLLMALLALRRRREH